MNGRKSADIIYMYSKKSADSYNYINLHIVTLFVMKVFSFIIHDSTQTNRKTIIKSKVLSILLVEKIILS